MKAGYQLQGPVQHSAQRTPPEHGSSGLKSLRSLLNINICRRGQSSEQACTYTLSSCRGAESWLGQLQCAALRPVGFRAYG